MKFVTSDGHTVDFDHTQSQVIKNIIEDCGEDDSVHVPIQADILSKTSYWMNQTTEPEESWETLVAMLRAADFLNMPEMLNRLGKRMADMLQGKPAKQVREMMSMLM